MKAKWERDKRGVWVCDIDAWRLECQPEIWGNRWLWCIFGNASRAVLSRYVRTLRGAKSGATNALRALLRRNMEDVEA